MIKTLGTKATGISAIHFEPNIGAAAPPHERLLASAILAVLNKPVAKAEAAQQVLESQAKFHGRTYDR